MALGLALQIRSPGAGWGAGAWQLAMAALAVLAYIASRHARHLSPAGSPPGLGTGSHRVEIFAAALGVCIAVALVAWGPVEEREVAVTAVAVAVSYGFYAAATRYFLPWAVIALWGPLLVGAALTLALSLPAIDALIGIVLVALQAAVALQVLRTGWERFSTATDMDVEAARLTAMLQEQNAIAEAAVQQKTRFLASASHDLRQPMHAISLYLDGLAEMELPDRIKGVVSDARVCAHDMIDMFRSVLDMSRLDARQTVPALSVFSMGALLSRVEKEFGPLAESRGVRLKVKPCADSVYSDPVMVERIVLNFVSNAVRHTPKGRVFVACRVRGRALRLAVYDTGRGIPLSQQQEIFEEFRRLDPSRPHDHTGGLGLGLAIVRRLAQALRLPLVVRSTPGRGSMFAVDLPLVHVARANAAATPRDANLPGRMIVLVDDDPSILQAASLILQAAGGDVIAASSGPEAMHMLAGSTRTPDLIICDFELKQDKTGEDVIRELREEFNADIPAVLVTGNTFGGTAERAARELRIPVLYKPIEAATLRTALEGLLAAQPA